MWQDNQDTERRKTQFTGGLEREEGISSKMDIDDNANLRLIIESIRKTAECAADTAEIGPNLTVNIILV